MSGIAHKVKDTVTPNNNTHTTSTTGHHDTTTPRTTTVPSGTTAGGPAVGTNYTPGTTGTTGTTGYTHTAGGPAPNTDGPHKSDMMNRADPRIDSDRDHSKNLGLNSSGTAATGSLANSQTANRDIGAPGIGGTTATHPVGTSATHGSSMTANHGPTGPSGGTIGNTHTTGGLGSHTTTSTGTREGEFGPHGGRLANAADPRVDSDLDGSKRFGGNTSTTTGTTAGIGSSHPTTGTTAGIGSTGRTTGTTGTSGLREGEVGPHSSRLANAADPRVDSDLDNTRHAGATRTTGATGTTGGLGTSHHTTGTTAGIGSTGRTTGTTGTSGVREGEFGPHSGRVANAADPRVDSDLDGSRNVGGTHTGAPATTGNLGSSHHTAASDTPGTARTAGGVGGTTHTTGHTTTTTGPGSKTTGPAPNTAGPHKSDMLNKIDPRVDSNLDGSKTVGGDKTHAADRRI